MILHDFQQDGHERAKRVLAARQHRMYVSPTGSGKSFILAANHEARSGDGLVTVAPTIEMLLGIARRCSWWNDEVITWSEARQHKYCEDAGLWTVMRLHNALVSARVDPPTMLQFDEAHHTVANSYETLHALCGDCPAVAYTATGFRGTPQETARLKAKWGEPEVLLTLKSAVDRGIIARPDMRVWPLVNDETIKVTAGEFETKAQEAALDKVIPALCERIRLELTERRMQAAGTNYRHPKRVTMVTAPGVASAKAITDELRRIGCFAYMITGDVCDTGFDHIVGRQAAFASIARAEAILVQVNVIGEGVDLPIRVQVDTACTMSPNRWMQRVGRGTRPTEEAPLYICTNHNIARHAYLWAGVLPSAVVRDAQQAWGPDFKPSRRILARAIGLDGFGRFKTSKIPMRDGTYGSLYALQTPNGTSQYAVFLHACTAEPFFFTRENVYTGEKATKRLDDGRVVEYKKKDYGPWSRIPCIPDLDGYVSTKSGNVTDKMLAFWKRCAAGRGLDDTHTPNWHEFQILPALLDSRTRFTE